ncbi:glycosyltransferase [Glaciibacter flavus]|uniref:glycosyltransferase n=1 Tax=Orlajensenia flava TaxID=2565934 RepID=UPI003AFF96E0
MPSSDILVVLPTLGDRLEMLAKTLETVDEQRESVSLTLVVVLPEGADQARALAEGAGAVVVDDPKTGISDAINRGLAARTTETYYAWIGDDDLFRPGGLARLQRMLDAEPGAVLAYGGCDYIDPNGTTIATSNAGRLAQFLLPWGPDLIPHPGTMIRLDALESIGGFDSALRYAMDLDAFLKLRSHGSFLCTRESVSAFRWHPDSLTVAGRRNSSRESEAVKRSHLPRALRSISPVWDLPIRWASAFAARRLSERARRLLSAHA